MWTESVITYLLKIRRSNAVPNESHKHQQMRYKDIIGYLW